MSQPPPIAALGAWSDNAERLVPRGQISWTEGVLGLSGSINSKNVAVAHKRGRQWLLRIPGWQWHVTTDMGVARMNQVPGDKIKATPVKSFRSSAAAKREAEDILREDAT